MTETPLINKERNGVIAMRITPPGAPKVYSKNGAEKKKESVSKTDLSQKNVDSIELSAAQPEKTTAQLIDTLKAQILQDVKAGIDTHRLDDLRREIASGDYDINPSDIVSRIIGG